MATLAELEAKLTSLQAKADAILNGGQGYNAPNRSLTRVDYATLQRQIENLERRIEVVRNSGRIPGSHVVFGGHRG